MTRTCLLLIAPMFLLGCPSEPAPVDDDDTVDEEQAQQTACDLATETGTPITAVTGLEPTPSAAMVIDEGPYLVDLIDGDHSFVHFEAGADDNEVVLFMSAADALENVWETDHIHTQGNPVPNPDCPDLIPEQHTLELHAGTWYLEIGVLSVDEVWLHLGTGTTEDE